jgi:hypothetical protein
VLENRLGVTRFRVLPIVGILLVAGCSIPHLPTAATVPPAWRNTNSWGPEANAARARGELQPCFKPRELPAWEEFGRVHIQTGDLLFRFGRYQRLSSWLTGCIMAGAMDSRFSHDGIACWEGGTLYVYDIEPAPESVRKVPFSYWALDAAEGSLAVKRLRPEYQPYIPQALAYIADAYHRQVAFDDAFLLDDDRLYCAKMIEQAFRSAGLALSEPVPICRLPHFRRFCLLAPLAYLASGVRVDERVYALGNDRYGTFGSPYLDTVYDARLPEPRSRSHTGQSVAHDSLPTGSESPSVNVP